ncbi:MAG: hypothetical protein LLG14_07740, partial [Nocardiaceae bacterium]|nr:hypothetical protein [Nocardiaceae bacterium]
YARLRSIGESFVTGLFEARNESPPADPQVISLAIVSFLIGFGIQRASDPSLPSHAIAPVMRLLLQD